MKNKLDLTIEDCQKVIEIYLKHRKTKHSYYLVQLPNDVENMLYKLRLAYAEYLNDVNISKSLTPKQLEDHYIKIRKSAKKLYNDLRKTENPHFFLGMISAQEGNIAPHLIEENTFNKRHSELSENFSKLEESLNWLTNIMDFCLAKNSTYPLAKKDSKKRQRPESEFIKQISLILSTYFESGGASRYGHEDENSAKGWKVECIHFLLKRLGISITKNKILEAALL